MVRFGLFGKLEAPGTPDRAMRYDGSALHVCRASRYIALKIWGPMGGPSAVATFSTGLAVDLRRDLLYRSQRWTSLFGTLTAAAYYPAANIALRCHPRLPGSHCFRHGLTNRNLADYWLAPKLRGDAEDQKNPRDKIVKSGLKQKKSEVIFRLLLAQNPVAL
ncbi:hypothetical protein B0T26DRAFT_750984 [Lasiosphaeria miniovina]|uniref:Uncharacterized protein n=1 Tax=Lasiosphaeria miniovina TaxID=1954250 RepID=A0AA40AJ50_9PEZI|nr:uncharacterized protein B0T26DRAFT_750984 [Lasiosphaeria miniovina]KAK0716836.1 hypothetical protein B0T26DRAFT_750984 [Lasiosphaeria miniovina]